jgi:phosphoserine phosphatase
LTKLLVVFDVDSTLIEDEVIELLADVAGKRAEVAAVTERAMAGELDFAESLVERVKTLAGLTSSVFESVFQQVTITQGAAQLIDAVHAAGGRVGAVSGGFSQVLTPLAEKLSLDFARANELEVIDGVLTGKVVGKIIDRSEKKNALIEWARLAGFDIAQTVAVGDGANDLEMMQAAGLSIAFNAKQIVRDQADLVIGKRDLFQLAEALGLTRR